MTVYDFSSGFANLNSAIQGLGKQMRDGREREEYDAIGKGIADGTIDYRKAAGRLTSLGKLDSATELLKMGEAATTRKLGQEAAQGLFGVLGGAGSPQAVPSGGLGALGSLAPVQGDTAPASLIQSESGNNWRAQNSATGAGGAVGHFGRAQFGQARLQEAAAAGAIPPGTTPQAFMQSPELQQSAERWHFGDLDSFIAKNGLDRAVGQQVAGIPVTIEGMRAVAHLGGKNGLQRFLQTGGQYNPADENGTRLSDYLRQHGGGGRTRIAEGNPDRAAPGAATAMADGSQPGFVIPQGAAPEPLPMSGRTFNAVQGGGAVQPVFQSEGPSQPWMNTALARPPVPRIASNDPASPQPQPQAPQPQGLASLGMGQYGPAPSMPDYSNANDAGARQLQVASEEQRRGLVRPDSQIAQPAPLSPAAYAGLPGGSPQQPGPRAAQGAPLQIAQSPAPAQGQPVTPVPSTEMPRPTNREEAKDYYATRQMEAAKGRAMQIATALANPNLPANARGIGEIYLKEALEASKAPDSVKEYTYAKGMGWTTAKSPNEYAKEKTKTSPAEEIEGRKASAAAAGLKPGDTGYQGYVLTGKMPREDMGPLTATDKKAILDADEGVLAANTAIDALKTAKKLSPQALGGWGASGKASVANNLPDWMVPDRLIGSPQQGESTAELENVVTSQALAQLKSIFGSAPTEGERKILLDIQGSIGQPDNVRQKIYDRGIAMAEKRLGFSQQRADELRGGGFYKPGSGQGRQQGGMTQPAPQQAQPQAQQPQQRQTVAAPAQAIEFLRANPGARQEFDAKYGQGASASVLGR
ncbi:hypothetical protein [Bosea sp. PAMC 26642]|uniref:hypothetical protein n=1 Tax=Bosea sp. (strain PAMC 26642) TaxID=1792307 RepID=UPI0007704DEF|nr:hypothetical protein [Bosea sp. PAMC 26642]AMJ59370.1 hypothetical protein AXW83_02780 [Bosea sp. PAMC 26642]